MEAKYVINLKENRDFLKNLSQDLLAFGNHFPSPEGSSYYLGDDGTPLTDRPRETWITCRMAHVYSIGSMLGYQGSKDLADAAINGLLNELHDNENGGWYSGITANHEILPNKQCYAHAFVILAATSGLLAKCQNAQELLEDALAIYDQRFWDGKPVVHDRMHWTLAEAINTSSVLYKVTGKQYYADLYSEFMKYLDKNVLDHANGISQSSCV